MGLPVTATRNDPAWDWERGELKHLSTRRKRKQYSPFLTKKSASGKEIFLSVNAFFVKERVLAMP